jgi:DNA polymerase III subunit epsilon
MNELMKIAFIDFETTGLDPRENYPTEIAVKLITFSLEEGDKIRNYQTLIRLPEGVEISEFITNLTGLTTEKVNSEGKPLEQVKEELREFITEDTIVVAQSANFDLGYLAVHFDIEPARFYCTKTIETLTNPHLSTSLKEAHARYKPEETFMQTHRAMDDVNMLMDIYDGQCEVHGEDIFFFQNKIAIMPDRSLVWEPKGAIYLDFSQKYYSSKTVEQLKADSAKLDALEAMGVDNWIGYDDAMEMLREGDED